MKPDRWLKAWVIVRLPLLIAVAAVAFSESFVQAVTLAAVHVIGTIGERVVLFAAFVVWVVLAFALASRARTAALRWAIPCVLAAVGGAVLYRFVPGPSPATAAVVLAAVLAINTLPAAWLERLAAPPGRGIAGVLFALGVGVSELLMLDPLAAWWRGRVGATRPAWLLAPALAALLADPYGLSDLRRALQPDPAVTRFASGNFNWIELDRSRRVLYAAGHGTDRVLAFDIDHLDRAPRAASVATGFTQAFALDARDGELFVHDGTRDELETLDAATLEPKRPATSARVSPGDVFTAWDPFTDAVVLASEADERVGTPTLIVDRRSGEVTATLPFDPGNIALHPARPWLYMSFLRRSRELVVYDLARRAVIRRKPVEAPLDRMIFMSGKDGLELWASEPTRSRVLRFDAETLEPRGAIRTEFGGRAIAADTTRHRLLCGSLVTHHLDVIDPAEGRRLARYNLGPWLRVVVLDEVAGVAYVAAHGGLFAVRYARGS